MTKTIYEQFEDWYGNNDLAYSNDVKNMAFKAWKAATKNFLSQGEPVAWRQTVHVEVNGLSSTIIFSLS